MRRFFAPPTNFAAGKVVLDENETRHLRDVLRIREGEIVNVFDGAANEFECRVESISKRESKLTILQKIEPTAPESNLDLTVCASILKGEKTDLAVQKAVELGVNRFVPMTSARCDVRPKGAEKRVERWRKIVLEASKQCGRARLMMVDEIQPYNALMRPSNHSKAEKVVLFTERDGGKFAPDSEATALTAFFGPEGGWDDAELDLARNAGALLVTFNGRVMKADTAVIAISAILQHHFGDLN